MLLDIMTISISILSILISLFSYLHKVDVSYPKIRLDPIKTQLYSLKETYKIIYSKSDGWFYLIAPFKINNVSPVKGKLYDVFIKERFILSPALTPEEIEQIKDLKPAITKQLPNNAIIFNKWVVAESFEEETLFFVFKLHTFFPIYRKTTFSLYYHFYGDCYKSRKKKFKLTLNNLVGSKNFIDYLKEFQNFHH